MKAFKYMSLCGLFDLASCFDAAESYTVTTDNATKYITLAPKGTHSQTLLYLHAEGSSAALAYSGYLKTLQIATLETKIIILNAPVADGNGYIWWNSFAKGGGTTDSLGNDILAHQTGTDSVDSATTIILALIESEKNGSPSSASNTYKNVSVVGFSQGGAATVATMVKYDKDYPVAYMIAYAGWMPVNKTNWVDNSDVVKKVKFLQLAGQDDYDFCPLSYTSYETNLVTLYPGSYEFDIVFKTVAGVGHEVTSAIAADMLLASTSTSNITSMKVNPTTNTCNTAPDPVPTKETVDADSGTYLQVAAFTSVASMAATLY